MPPKKEISNEQKNLIQGVYHNGNITLSELSEKTGLSRSLIKRIAKEMGYDEPSKRKTKFGVEKMWTKEEDDQLIKLYQSEYLDIKEIAEILITSKDTVIKRAKKLDIKKVPKISWLTPEREEAIKNWDGEISISNLANQLSIHHATLRDYMQKHGIDTMKYARDNYKRDHRSVKVTDEMMSYLENPRYPSWELAKMFNVSEGFIQRKRKSIFERFVVMRDTVNDFSLAEYKLANILDELDLLYKDHHTIENWSVDFYLGQKIIIEVQGDYWHSDEQRVERDKRKKEDLESKGYRVLHIWESELENIDKVKEKIMIHCRLAVKVARLSVRN